MLLSVFHRIKQFTCVVFGRLIYITYLSVFFLLIVYFLYDIILSTVINLSMTNSFMCFGLIILIFLSEISWG